MKNCKFCGKELSKSSIQKKIERCSNCYHKSRIKENATRKIKHYCKNCSKIIDRRSIRCINCCAKIRIGKKRPEHSKIMKGINNPMFGSYRIGKNNPNFGKRHNKKNDTERHHIDLDHDNNNKSNILLWTKTNHIRLHQRAYEYLVKKELIRKYIKWFIKRYYIK